MAIYVLAFGYGMIQQGQWNKRQTVPFCETKQRLIGDFITANHELIELQNQQTQAVIDHESDFTRFDEPIHMAREKKDKAKYVLMAHTSEHHC